MRKKRILASTLLLVVSGVLVGWAAFSGVISTQAAYKPAKINQQKWSFIKKKITEDQRHVHDYWTTDRMKQARPAEELLEDLPEWQTLQANKRRPPRKPTPRPTMTATPKPGATSTSTPKPGVTATPTPKPGATSTPTPKPGVTATPTPKPGATATVQPTVTATPGPNLTSGPIPTDSYSTYPFSTIGKVFFTDKKTGANYVCSGTAVISGNKSTVDTAGHCVMQGGSGSNYYTNWSFCPQYIDGTCPKGRWTAKEVAVSTTWANSGSFSQDLAAVVVNTNASGQFLTDVVGGVQFGANRSRSLQVVALGYPAASPFNGKRMQSCVGTTRDYPSGNPKPIGVSCNMTGGSSGGGWLSQINGTWYIVGHNDFGSSAYPNVMWSPYYGDDALSVFNSVQNN